MNLNCRTSEGKTIPYAMPIVLPAKTAAIEQFAASELQAYFKKMTGIDHAIVTEGAHSDGAVYVGATEAAAAAGVTFADNGLGEGWAIEARDGSLYLVGGKTRGVLYAVYHLLEDVFGVRWWNMCEEYVPASDALTIPDDYASGGVPAFRYRDMAVDVEEGTEFFARNRANGWYTHTPAAYGGVEGVGGPWFIHTHNRYFPADPYFSEHPEWYAVMNEEEGVRTNEQLCLSSEGLLEAFVQKLLAQIADDYKKADETGETRPVYFDVSPSDNYGHCQCAKCKESRAASGPSGHVLKFANKLAAEVAKVYPEVKLTVLAYAGYIEPPIDDTKPADNVVVWFAYIQMDLLHSLNHGNNADFLKYIDAWLGRCGTEKLFVWDYGIHRGGIFPTAYKYGENFKTLNTLGPAGYFLELQNCINADFWDMKLWLTTKLMEDPTQDYEALMNDFLCGYYGVAGEYVKAYLNIVHTRAEKDSGIYLYSCSTASAGWMTFEDVMKADACFDEAFAAAEDDKVLLRRLRSARRCLDQLIVDNYKKWKLEAAKNDIELPLTKEAVSARLVTTLQELIEQRGSYDPNGESLLAKYQKYVVNEKEELPADLPSFTADMGDELSPIHPEHLYIYDSSMFYLYSVGSLEKDPDSLTGSAAVFDISEVPASAHISKYYALSGTNTLPVHIYAIKATLEGTPETYPVLDLTAEDIIADGKYHIYKGENFVMPAGSQALYLFMFRDWVLQNNEILAAVTDMPGKSVDIYLSMKVTGDISCEDPDNLPVYSIDRMIAVEHCEDFVEKWTDTDAESGTADTVQVGKCVICQKIVTRNAPNTAPEHGHF